MSELESLYLKAERGIAEGDYDQCPIAYELLQSMIRHEPEIAQRLGDSREQRLYDLYTSLNNPYRKPHA